MVRTHNNNQPTTPVASPSYRQSLWKFRHPRALAAAILILVLLTFGGLWWLNKQSDQELSDKQARLNSQMAEADKLIAKLKQERLDRERQAAEEAKKLADEAAAQAAQNKLPAAQQKLAANPTACNPSTTHNNPASPDVIVNKKHCIMPISYAPSDLVTAYGATMSSAAANQFAKLVEAAARDGVAISASSSYRSYSAQVATYNHWVTVNGSVQAADKVSARPGYSEHQTGLAVDVTSNGCALDCFASTVAYPWMKAHAHKYGFVERYPSGKEAVTGYNPEPWHYRFVGTSTAAALRSSGLTTLEEYWNISGGDY